MNLEEFFRQTLDLIGTADIRVVLGIFLICLIGEALVVSVPYLLESVWLMAGYQFSVGVLSLPKLLLLVLAGIAGREFGGIVLYCITRSGSGLLTKYWNRIKPKREDAIVARVARRLNTLSPFSVALGRLLWFRIPLTIILGANRRLKVLVVGILLSSLVYDGVYIGLGATVGTTTSLPPHYVLLYSLAGLTAIYAIVFLVRRLLRPSTNARIRNDTCVNASPPGNEKEPQNMV